MSEIKWRHELKAFVHTAHKSGFKIRSVVLTALTVIFQEMKSDWFVQRVYVVSIWCIYICCYNNDVSVSKRLSHKTTESCQCE